MHFLAQEIVRFSSSILPDQKIRKLTKVRKKETKWEETLNHLAKLKQMMRANCNNQLTAVHPKEACQKNHNQVAAISLFFFSTRNSPSNKAAKTPN